MITALAELDPLVEDLLGRHLAAAKEWFPHEYVPWDLGRDFEGHPWEPGDSSLSPIAQIAMQLNLLTEDNLPSYHLALRDLMGGRGAWGAWIGRWTAEEGRHSIAIRDYLTVTRGVDPIALERERMKHVANGFAPRRIDGALEGIIYVTLQELATRIAHRNTGAVCGDPAAERLMNRVAADESLHYAFYRDVASGALELAPSEMVVALRNQVIGFSMPGFELREYRRRALRMARAGIYDLRVHHDQVLCPVVLKHWKLRELSGLDDRAEAARDEILGFLTHLDSAAPPPLASVAPVGLEDQATI